MGGGSSARAARQEKKGRKRKREEGGGKERKQGRLEQQAACPFGRRPVGSQRTNVQETHALRQQQVGGKVA